MYEWDYNERIENWESMNDDELEHYNQPDAWHDLPAQVDEARRVQERMDQQYRAYRQREQEMVQYLQNLTEGGS